MARSFSPLCALFIMVVIVMAPYAESAISCGSVVIRMAPCVNYVRGMGALSPGCCSSIRNLNAAVKTTPDRQQACSCLKSAALNIHDIKPDLASGLPGKCGVNVGFPISNSVDCSKVQ